MRTDPGLVRELNEDAVAWITPQDQNVAVNQGSLALVADGMGGHAAGEVASEIAVTTVRRVFYELPGSIPQVLGSAFMAANRAILDWSEGNPECKGMGTTCTAIAIRDDKAWLAHVGDSRAYHWRDGVMTQLSDDQTLVAQMVREGQITPEEAQNSPMSNVILQALGSHAEVAPVVWSEPIQLAAGDILVLCTDGLTGVVSDATIAQEIERLPPGEACEALIRAALAAGAPDNVSVGVFQMTSAAERPADAKSDNPGSTTRRLGPMPNERFGEGATQTRKMNVM
jgi:PPM family protein phosphatase